jgi:DNA-directed RNA polymerase subunit M/transcription elongation factor TFIIS
MDIVLQMQRRQLVINKFIELLKQLKIKNHKSTASLLEQKIYDKNSKNGLKYSHKCYNLINALDIKSPTNIDYHFNPLIIDLLNNKKIEELVSLNDYELSPNAVKETLDYIKARNEQKINKKISEIYKCSNCHQKKCEYEPIQLRCLDEPMDIKCTCLVCDNQFIVKC